MAVESVCLCFNYNSDKKGAGEQEAHLLVTGGYYINSNFNFFLIIFSKNFF